MKIKNHDIRVKRGEECAIQFRVAEHGAPYAMNFADRIQFVVKRILIDSEKPVIDRTAIGSDVIRLKASDTADQLPGKYRYMVRLIKSDGSTHILVDAHNFEILGGDI